MTDYERLYERYFNDVYLYILRLSGDVHIAEEVTSDTFFSAMRSIDSFRGDCDVRVWLCQIAKNRYYSYMKRRKRAEPLGDEEIENIPDQSHGIDEEFVRREDAERIKRVLHKIEEPYREVFMWRVFAELSFREIGQIFGKTENWACVTYHRGRKKILLGLEEEKGEK